MRQMRRGHQRLMLLNGGGDDVYVRFQARAHALVRLAVSGAAVQREILRQHVQQHAVALQAARRGRSSAA